MAPASTRKRKVAELGDSKQTIAKRPKQTRKNNKKEQSVEDACPYKVFCPTDANDPQQDGAYTKHVSLAEDFECDYAVIPGSWGSIKQFKNVKLQDTTFTQGDIIYICKHDPPPPPPPEHYDDEQCLAYEKKNYWVGKIVEARAKHDREVWLLVAWLYWPEEIPEPALDPKQKRKWYGKGELVLSNAFDIIDAMSISSKVEADRIGYYDEWSDTTLAQGAKERYWRQTFNTADYSEKSPRTDLFSTLRTFCKCTRPHSPDMKMYHCSNKSCNNWNHEDCLLDEIGGHAYTALEAGKMDDYVAKLKPTSSPTTQTLADRVLSPVKAVGKMIVHGVEDVLEDGVDAVHHETLPELHDTITANGDGHNTKTNAKRGRPKKNGKPWTKKLNISVINEDGKPLIARIEKKPPFNAKADSQKQSWDVRVDCLCCGQTMD